MKICFMMLLRKMNIHCLFNILNNGESCAFFFHTLLYCESLNTQVLWKPTSAEDRGENSVLELVYIRTHFLSLTLALA